MKVKDIIKFVWNVIRNRRMLGILQYTDYVQAFANETPESVGVYIGFAKYKTNPEADQGQLTAIKDFVREMGVLFPEGVVDEAESMPVFSLLVNPKIAEEIMDVGRGEERGRPKQE